MSPVRGLLVAGVATVWSWAVYLLARRLAGSVTLGAATAMIWSLLTYVYPLLYALARPASLKSEEPFALVYLAVAAAICAAVLSRRKVAGGVPLVLSTTVAVVLVSAIAVQTVPQYLLAAPFRVLEAAAALPARMDATNAAGRPPNIYHLVLDGLGRSDVLKARYDVDLSEVAAALAAAGFVIEDRAYANYGQTYLSIASMLNAAYIDVPAGGEGAHSRRPLHEAIQHNTVFSTLRRAGYDVVFLASDYSATADAADATACACPATLFGEFESSVVYRTPFRALWPGDADYLPHLNRIERTLNGFAAAGASARGRPQYTFAHILSPHPPFILASDGTFVPPRRAFTFFDGTMFPGQPAEYRAGYARQVHYLMRRFVTIASALRARDPDGVIIVSGDHGPRLRFSASDAKLTDAQEVFPIFLAIRWGQHDGGAPRVESPVNLYREILHRYLGVSIAALPDRAYVSSFATPYELFEVDRGTLETVPPLASHRGGS